MTTWTRYKERYDNNNDHQLRKRPHNHQLPAKRTTNIIYLFI